MVNTITITITTTLRAANSDLSSDRNRTYYIVAVVFVAVDDDADERNSQRINL